MSHCEERQSSYLCVYSLLLDFHNSLRYLRLISKQQEIQAAGVNNEYNITLVSAFRRNSKGLSPSTSYITIIATRAGLRDRDRDRTRSTGPGLRDPVYGTRSTGPGLRDPVYGTQSTDGRHLHCYVP